MNPLLRYRVGQDGRARLRSALGWSLVLGLLAAPHLVVAQVPEGAPRLALVLGPEEQWLEPGLLVVPFALRNTGTEPLVVTQHPGLMLGFSCRTENGARGSIPGGVACGGVDRETLLTLGPGEALMGEKVLRVPAECEGGLTVEGLFETYYASERDLPMSKARIHSKPFLPRRP